MALYRKGLLARFKDEITDGVWDSWWAEEKQVLVKLYLKKGCGYQKKDMKMHLSDMPGAVTLC